MENKNLTKTKLFNVRLTDSQHKALRKASYRNETTMSDLLLRALNTIIDDK
jgi:uncharacterized protein (DUF1778 family)